MRKPSRRLVLAVLALGVVGFAFGVWVLLHPASIFVQPWRAERAAAPVDGVLLGPYPVEADFVELKKRGVPPSSACSSPTCLTRRCCWRRSVRWPPGTA